MPKSQFFRLCLGLMLVLGLTACRINAPTPPPTPEPTQLPPTPAPFSRPHPSLSDVRVREAIADCTNPAELLQSVYPWFDQPEQLQADSIVPRDHWAYTGNAPGFAHHPFQPQLGGALLDEAGWTLKNGADYRTNANGDVLALKLTTTNAVFRQIWTAKFVEQMKACGVQILPFYVPADWLFGEDSGLQRRDFELTAFAWVISPYFDIQSVYPCDQIPGPLNHWQGQNYNGWCNLQVSQAVPVATYHPETESGQAAYRLIQQKFSAEMPSLPLFQRLAVYAVNPRLLNFAPDSGEVYTWNADQWQVPGKDTLVILQASKPRSLLPNSTAYDDTVLQALIYGNDATALNYHYQPVTLLNFPNSADSTLTIKTVQARSGDAIVDIDNRAVSLGPGVTVYNADDQPQAFTGSVALKQFTTTYQFKPGLTWADGVPVTLDDYRLAYRATCQPDTAPPDYLMINGNCDKIASVNFLGDTSYTVTWKPGFENPTYQIPPFGRLPDHLVLKDGRQLRDVPVAQWPNLPELTHTPLGVGPYTVAEWKLGDSIRFTANPYYVGPKPATATIVVRFIDSFDTALDLLKSGQADVLDPESFDITHDTPALLQAQSEGMLKVIPLPMNVYEHLDFNFSIP